MDIDARVDAGPCARPKRSFARQFTVVDTEMSVIMAGESGFADGNASDCLATEEMDTNGNDYIRWTGFGKVAIVTEATSNMGVELTKHLHLKGYKVALVDSHESAGPEIVLEIGDYENVQFFRADMTSYRSQAATFQRIHQIWGRLDLCFLHAGISGNSLARIDQGREIGVLETPPEPDVSSPETSACKEIVYGVQLATHLMRCNSPQIGGRIIVVAGISNHCSGTSHTEEPSPTVITTQYVQSIAPSLKVEMKILLNMVRSDAIATPSWSREHVEVVSPRRLDSIRDVLEACDRLTEDETGISGEVLDI